MKKLFCLFLFSGLLFNLGSSRFIGVYRELAELKWLINYNHSAQTLSAIILSLCLAYILLKVEFVKKRKLFLFFLLSSLFVHYRHDLYFYFDEWTLINVFQDRSILTYRHNEHYLPLFFSFLKAETNFFGMHYGLYLLLSSVIHSLNAVLLYVLCLGIFEKQEHRKLIARIVSTLFLLSALHSEALHWAFEQSLLLCASLILVSIYCARKYFQSGENKFLIPSIVAASLSPFVFGNGFSVPIILILFWFLEFPNLQYARLRNLLLPIIVWFGICSLFYFSDSLAQHPNQEHGIARVFAYLFAGSQLGIVLRGLGFYPSLELNAASKFLASMPLANAREFPEVFISLFGFLISLLSLFLTYRFKPTLLKIWLVGFFLPIVTLILPALTRWHYGTAQALSLRYSYLGIFGLFLMLSPCLLLLIENRKGRNFLGILIAIQVYLQLCLSQEFRYFSDYGLKHRAYVEQLIQWKCVGTGGNKPIPTHLETISPGFNQDLIYKAVIWLDRNPCD